MCGVFAYCGQGDAARQVINGLKRLEYRGYDSWGMAIAGHEQLETYKYVGAISDQETIDFFPSTEVALGHTRWATHGAVNLENCHPHLSMDSTFSVVHNGIVENYQSIKDELIEKGHIFYTETDTEVIVRLIEELITEGESFTEVVQAAFLRLTGRNTIVVLVYATQAIIAIRHGSPLVVGKGEQGYFFASDSLSFAEETKQCLMIQDLEMVSLQAEHLEVLDLRSNQHREWVWQCVNHEFAVVDKEGYPHYMLKEVMEQWQTISQATQLNESDLDGLVQKIEKAPHVFLLGAGGAFFVADQTAFFMRTFAQIAAFGVRSYEVASVLPMVSSQDVVIAISQSGETADTLNALQAFKAKGCTIASVLNMPGSSMTHLSDFTFYSQSGPEICVLSTKSCSAQLTFGYLLAQKLAGHWERALNDVVQLSHVLSHYLNYPTLEKAGKASKAFGNKDHLFVLGSDRYYKVAQLAALNIKEASTVHAEAFSGGELKHGVLALIEQGTPVVVYWSEGEMGNMEHITHELKSRGAFIVGIAHAPHFLFDAFLPLPGPTHSQASRITDVIPGQFLAYQLALLRGQNPDRPRNLAKSVTVI